MALRWGICSASRISHDFAYAVSTLDPKLHQVVAIAARSLERAGEFATRHNIQNVYGSYEDLAKDTNIDIVYVGSINSEHCRNVKLFLNHDKHVLCEKPLGINLTQVREMVSLAKERKKFFMEGVFSRFFPVYRKIQEILDSKLLGDMSFVSATAAAPMFSLDSQHSKGQKELGGGACLYLGMYAIQFVMFVFGNQDPLEMKATGHLFKTGVDECGQITFLYPNNAMASVTFSANASIPCEANICGTLGRIKVYESVWGPQKMDLTIFETGKSQTFEYPLPEVPECPLFYNNSMGLKYEADAVRQAIQEGLTEHPLMTHQDSIQLASFVQKTRHAIGYFFEDELKKE